MTIPFYEDIAVLILTELALADPGRPVPLSGIAARHRISPPFLKKIIRLLKAGGFVTSREGVGGGYMLAVDPARTNLWDIFDAIDQSKRAKEPAGMLYASCPVNSACLPEIIRKTVRSSIRKSLGDITLGSLVAGVTV